MQSALFSSIGHSTCYTAAAAAAALTIAMTTLAAKSMHGISCIWTSVSFLLYESFPTDSDSLLYRRIQFDVVAFLS
jgi:hypothetical protein